MIQNISLNNSIDCLFGDLFYQSDITEIVINKPHSLFFENRTGFHAGTEEQNKQITLKNCQQFANALASYSNQQFNSKNPIMGATLPTGERVQIIMPPAIDHEQFSITIRKPNAADLDLSYYKNNGFFSEIVMSKNESTLNKNLNDLLKVKDYASFFDLAVSSAEKNILIVGETGSGKTTFMKSLINSIDKNERLLTIEDTRELFLSHKNSVNLLYPQGASSSDPINATVLLKASLRMKPDRILVSELRGGETYDYINAVSSGHGGSITSSHSGSVKEAFMRLILMFLQNDTGSRIPYETVESMIKDTIDIVAVIKAKNGKRNISELHWKDYRE